MASALLVAWGKRIAMFLVGLFFGGLTLIPILWAIVRSFGGVLKKKTHAKPAITEVGEHIFVHANGIKFHTVQAGSRDKPLMLFLHGFPQCWYTWRHQLNQFKSTHHAVAFDMRGYGESDKPADTAAYQPSELAADVAELVKALGHKSCVLVGHDWGAAIAWAVAHKYPEIIDRLIIMNAPHPRYFQKNMSFTQFRKSWYIFMFQLPLLPELMMSLKDFAAIKNAFVGRTGVTNPACFSPEDLEMYKYAISQPGALTAALNYYRNVWRPLELRGKITAPTLVLWGENDHALGAELNNGLEHTVTKLTYRPFPNVSHWVPEEVPGVVCEEILRFLEAK